MPVRTGIGVTVNRGYPGRGAGVAPDVEHVQNGDFTSATGWTAAGGWAIAAGVATQAGAGGLLFNVLSLPVVNGGTYTFSVAVNATNNADDTLIFLNTNGTTAGAQPLGNINTGTGTKTIGPFIATGAWTHLIIQAIAGLTETIDNVSLIGP